MEDSNKDLSKYNGVTIPKQNSDVHRPIIDSGNSDSFLVNTTLKEFLNCICNNEDQSINYSEINNEVKALDFILKKCKAKKYVGVGVGGLVVNENFKDPLVLLYLRPKNPEKYKWSIVGGSIEFGQNAKDALINEFINIIGIQITPDDLVPLRITNHKIINDHCNYHYLSPAYIAKKKELVNLINNKINNTNLKSDSDKQALARNLIVPADENKINILKRQIDSGNYFLNQWESDLMPEISNKEERRYIVKWFKASEINDPVIFSTPTIKAVESYFKRKNEINKLTKAIKDICIKEITGFDD